MVASDFGDRFKLLRIAAKLSVKNVCKSSGISEKKFYRIESGHALPNAKEITDICSVLVCDPNKLLGFPDKDPSGWGEYATRSATLIENMPLASQKVGFHYLSMLHLNAAVKNSLELSGGINIDDLVSELGL